MSRYLCKATSSQRQLADTCKQQLKASVPLSNIKFNEFDAAFILLLTSPGVVACSPGGHGACVDFPDNAMLASGLEQMLKAGKVVGSVCHGPMSFVGLKAADGQPFVKGKK
eukprot:scaffold46087_cov14-Tisochrysis_lutea.AAC.1